MKTDRQSREAGTHKLLRALTSPLPHMGVAGSRSAHLHEESTPPATTPAETPQRLNQEDRLRLRVSIYLGTVGSCMIALGGWGAGAWPVVNSPVWRIPAVNFLTRMLHTSTTVVFMGIGLLVVAWLLLARLCIRTPHHPTPLVPLNFLWRSFVAWVFPLLITAPLFTQDIYSYLAQGSIAARGWDPYSAGPVDLLGADDVLARSVPLMWSHSPSPYGPTALGYGALISLITQDATLPSILLHRLVSIASLALVAWALVRLSRRCHVPPQAALWLGVLNPLTILHLVGGIHNEAAMLGLMLTGMELVLRGADKQPRPRARRWILITAGISLITAAGLVKVTALMALGFAAVAVALWWGGRLRDLLAAATLSAAISTAVAVILSLATGVGFGWITSQGGATQVVSWMSMSTLTGLASSTLGMQLGLGDHQDAALGLFRTLGIAAGVAWVMRMLWASFKERIHPIGGLGVAMFCLVVFFPVVHPWYLLWAILPLAAWANRGFFIYVAAGYSTAFSFFILPRGLGLPPTTVLYIYVMFTTIFALALLSAWLVCRSHPLWAQALSPLPRRR